MKSIKKLLAVMLSVIMALGVVSVCAFAEDEITDTIISEIDITVSAPVAGEYAFGDYAFDGVDYTIDFYQWVNYETGDVLYSSDESATVVEVPFEADSAYVVCLTVAAADGFVFDAEENLIVSVNGYEAQIVDRTEDGKELSFSCVFECEDEADIGGGDDTQEGGFSFDQLLNLLKSVFLAFVRFLGSLIGL